MEIEIKLSATGQSLHADYFHESESDKENLGVLCNVRSPLCKGLIPICISNDVRERRSQIPFDVLVVPVQRLSSVSVQNRARFKVLEVCNQSAFAYSLLLLLLDHLVLCCL